MFDLSNLPRPVVRYGLGLWRRRWTVVAIAWITALVGWFGVWLLPDQFESRAQVFVQTETILEPVMSGVTARPNYERRVSVMRQQLLTRPNVEEIIYRSGLDKTIEASSEIDRRAKLEKLIDWVSGKIKIESPLEQYFDITYKYGDPEISRNVVDAVLNLLIEQDLGASIDENNQARRLLDLQIANFDGRLTAKEREVAEFRRIHADELSVLQGNTRQREMRETEQTRIADEISLMQRRLITLRNLLSTTPRTSSGDELDGLMVELAQLRSQYHEEHPDILAVRARIEQLQKGVGGVLPTNPEYLRIRNEVRTAEDTIAALKEREVRLASELEDLAFIIGQAPGVEAELQRIIRDYEQTQKSYEDLVQRRDRLALTASLGAGGQGVEYKIFERPAVSLVPSSPPRLVLILAVLVMAIGAGGAAAMGLTHLEKSFTQTSELQEAFGLPVLGAIGEVSSTLVKAHRRIDQTRLAGACAALLLATLGYIYLEVLRLPSVKDDTGPQSARVEGNVGLTGGQIGLTGDFGLQTMATDRTKWG